MNTQRPMEETPALCCSFCGREIPPGRHYWYISGYVLCPGCLPDFARAEYRGYRRVRGREGMQ